MSNEQSQQGKKILTQLEYQLICKFINEYHGLAIECELEMRAKFTDVHRMTLKSILQTEYSNRMRSQHWRFESFGKKYLQIFDANKAANPNCESTLLIKIANMEGITPMNLCRAILQEKYQSKMQMLRMIKYPHLIDDPQLAANVIQCTCSDNQTGPLMDLRCRFLGEEYEFKLKQLAIAAGMHYHDENDLRRLGYDKTPDIKMIVPFLYKGEVINWIESKATFGDTKTHKRHTYQQLNSYSNRFGPGMIIYWFGYHEETPDMAGNSVGITVLADFPSTEHLTFLDLEKASEQTAMTTTTTTSAIPDRKQ